MAVGQEWGNPKMGRPGRWTHGPKPAVPWWLDPYPLGFVGFRLVCWDWLVGFVGKNQRILGGSANLTHGTNRLLATDLLTFTLPPNSHPQEKTRGCLYNHYATTIHPAHSEESCLGQDSSPTIGLPLKTPSPGEVNLLQPYSPCYPQKVEQLCF